MPTITFVEEGGWRIPAKAEPGDTVMQAAAANMVDGVVAECGGHLICGTCHVILAPEDFARFPPPGALELSLLEAAPGRGSTSRLSCRLEITAQMPDMTVQVPAEQA